MLRTFYLMCFSGFTFGSRAGSSSTAQKKEPCFLLKLLQHSWSSCWRHPGEGRWMRAARNPNCMRAHESLLRCIWRTNECMQPVTNSQEEFKQTSFWSRHIGSGLLQMFLQLCDLLCLCTDACVVTKTAVLKREQNTMQDYLKHK